MKKGITKGILLISTAATLLSFDIPKGWSPGGSNMKEYAMGIDKGSGKDGKNAATIQSIEKNITDFGTLLQNCSPDKFAGKRVRMSGYMKTKDVSDWAGFWLRVDTREGDMPFDNMHDGKKNRSVTGTTEWTKYEIVLDVPIATEKLAFGALLSGTGQIWFDDLKFEIVDNSIETTGTNVKMPETNKLQNPLNLSFEE